MFLSSSYGMDTRRHAKGFALGQSSPASYPFVVGEAQFVQMEISLLKGPITLVIVIKITKRNEEQPAGSVVPEWSLDVQ